MQAFNTVTQGDSFMMRNDSRTMKAIAFVTILFLPITTVAVRQLPITSSEGSWLIDYSLIDQSIFGSQFFLFDPIQQRVQTARDFWLFWCWGLPVSMLVPLAAYFWHHGTMELFVQFLIKLGGTKNVRWKRRELWCANINPVGWQVALAKTGPGTQLLSLKQRRSKLLKLSRLRYTYLAFGVHLFIQWVAHICPLATASWILTPDYPDYIHSRPDKDKSLLSKIHSV